MKRGKTREDNKVEYGTISLPTPLIDKIKKKIEGTGFSSVSSYIAFVLRELIISGEESSSDISRVKKKLISSGYLD